MTEPEPHHRCPICGETEPPDRVELLLACPRHRSRERWNTVVRIHPARPDHHEEIRRITVALWGQEDLVCFDRTFPVLEQHAFVADAGGAIAGFVAVHVEGEEGILVALAVPPLYQGLGIGGSLLSAGMNRLRAEGVREIRIATTNDNLPALALYQRRGFVIEEVVPGLVAGMLEERLGAVPAGIAGIPVRDEVRLVYRGG
jgi:ribosomal protein S18 acetylase RimI-like enzyme